MDTANGLTMDPNPPPSRNPNLDLLEEQNEKELYKRMPGFVGLRDETDPLRAEAEAMRATVSGSTSPLPPVSGPQRVTGELLASEYGILPLSNFSKASRLQRLPSRVSAQRLGTGRSVREMSLQRIAKPFYKKHVCRSH